MGEGADMGAAAGEMGGGEAAAGGEGGAGGMLGGGGEADTPIAGSQPATTGEGGSGGGMLSFAVSDNMAGMAGSGSTTGISTPTTDVSGSATTPANASAQAGTGDIERKNPFGGTAGTTQKAPPGEISDKQKVGQVLKDMGKKTQDDAAQGGGTIAPPSGGGNSYGALFGSPNLMGRQSAGSAPSPMSMPGALQTPQVSMAPAMAGGIAAPQPMQIQTTPPPAIPQAQLGSSVSDARAKRNVAWANKDVDRILQNVYDKITNKGKR